MRIKYTFKNIKEENQQDLKTRIEKVAQEEIEPMLKRLGSSRVRLAAQVEFLQNKHIFSVALRLHMPKKLLISREEDKDFDLALKESFSELKSQLDKYLSRLRREDVWKRKARRAQLRRLKAAAELGAEEERQVYYELIRTHLPKLERVVRHELTYMRAKGDLPPDYPRIEDVVDETLARAYKTLNNRPTDLSIDTWLIQIAIEVIADEVAKFRAEEGMDSLEKSVSPLELISEDEIFEFWQPDEMLTIEDLAADDRSHPVQEPTEEKERRIYLYKLLALLPVKWRQVLNLMLIEGLPKSEIAEALGADELTIEQWISHMEAFLAEKMKEAGYAPPESGSYFDYLVPVYDLEEYKEQVEEELRETLSLPEA